MTNLPARSAKESVVDMVQLVLPGNANALGAAFGGSVMSWVDIAAAVSAQRHCRQQVVTASMDDLHFHAPIKVGWAVNLRAKVIAAFNTSMEIGVTVHSENPMTGERTLCTSALLTFVALDQAGVRMPVPPLKVETAAEAEAVAEATQRKKERLERRNIGTTWRSAL